MPNNLLLSCAGRRVELLQIWKRTFLDLGIDAQVVAADAQPFAPAFVLADRQAIVPKVCDPHFVDAMLRTCQNNDVRWVIPTIDTELPILSEARETFLSHGIEIMVSDAETIAIASDKRRTHEWFVANGFPTFRQADIATALADPDWVYPCFAKPACGSRSIGARRIESREALCQRQAESDGNHVVESLGHGVEVTVDAWISPKTGKCTCVVPRQRIEVRDGEVAKAKTIDAPEIIKCVRNVAEKLPGVRGTICVQLFYEPSTKEIALMEINPRFGGGYPLTDAAGGYFTRWLIEDSLGLPSTTNEDWMRNLVMLRYDQSCYIKG